MIRHFYRVFAMFAAALCLNLGAAGAQQRVSHGVPAPAIQPQTPLSEDPARNPATTLTDTLRSLASRSGVVFIGRVDRIERTAGVVTVTLAVLDPVLGNPGPTYTLREWAGLWTLGRQRYSIGQRALFFLHTPAASGLSSPVDGQYGVVPLLPTTAGSAALLDVRWIATRLQRTTATQMEEDVAVSIIAARAVVAHWHSPEPTTDLIRYPLAAALRSTTEITQ